MLIQMPQTPTVPKKWFIIILLYLGKMSQIVKTRLTKTMNKHMKFVNWELFSKLIIDLETISALKILFLNHYGQAWFINFRVEATQ